MQPGSTTLS